MSSHTVVSGTVDFLFLEVFRICYLSFENLLSVLFRVDYQLEVCTLSGKSFDFIHAVISIPVGLHPHGVCFLQRSHTLCRFVSPLQSTYHLCGLHRVYQVELRLGANGLGIFDYTVRYVGSESCTRREYIVPSALQQRAYPICCYILRCL